MRYRIIENNMKKLLFIACLPIFLCMFQCEREVDCCCNGSFYVKNDTDEAIEICFSDSLPDVRSYVIEPKDSALLRFVTTARIDGYPSFRMFLKTTTGGNCEKSLSILKDGETVKTWLLSRTDEAGRQFFDEALWRHYVLYNGRMPDIFIWVFDILPEDIGPAD